MIVVVCSSSAVFHSYHFCSLAGCSVFYAYVCIALSEAVFSDMLLTINMSNCTDIAPDAWRLLAGNCPRLQNLNIVHCATNDDVCTLTYLLSSSVNFLFCLGGGGYNVLCIISGS